MSKNLRWPAPMPRGGRLSEGKAAAAEGYPIVCSPTAACPQIVHLNLFFDGTNNNDAQNNPFRDSLSKGHTNVARLYNACKDDRPKGTFRFYVQGPGTPFPEIGETEYSTLDGGASIDEATKLADVWAAQAASAASSPMTCQRP